MLFFYCAVVVHVYFSFPEGSSTPYHTKFTMAMKGLLLSTLTSSFGKKWTKEHFPAISEFQCLMKMTLVPNYFGVDDISWPQ